MKIVTVYYRHAELEGERCISLPIGDNEIAYRYASALAALLPVGYTDIYVKVTKTTLFQFNDDERSDPARSLRCSCR